MEKFYKRFTSAMKEKGLKQSEISEMTGIAPGTISNYAVGKYAPKGINLEKIAIALDVNEAWLDGYDAPKERKHSLTIDLGRKLEPWEIEYYSRDIPFAERDEEVTREEMNVLTAYRDAEDHIKKAVRVMLGVEE